MAGFAFPFLLVFKQTSIPQFNVPSFVNRTKDKTSYLLVPVRDGDFLPRRKTSAYLFLPTPVFFPFFCSLGRSQMSIFFSAFRFLGRSSKSSKLPILLMLRDARYIERHVRATLVVSRTPAANRYGDLATDTMPRFSRSYCLRSTFSFSPYTRHRPQYNKTKSAAQSLISTKSGIY